MSNPAGADFRSVARTAAPAGCRVETSVAPGRPHQSFRKNRSSISPPQSRMKRLYSVVNEIGITHDEAKVALISGSITRTPQLGSPPATISVIFYPQWIILPRLRSVIWFTGGYCMGHPSGEWPCLIQTHGFAGDPKNFADIIAHRKYFYNFVFRKHSGCFLALQYY